MNDDLTIPENRQHLFEEIAIAIMQTRPGGKMVFIPRIAELCDLYIEVSEPPK